MLNENDIGHYRTFCKLSPPLRGEEDRRALVEGVADGTIDVIVSGHDPQSADTKRLPFAEAAFGAIGWKPEVDMREGLRRLIEWRASHKAEVDARRKAVAAAV